MIRAGIIRELLVKTENKIGMMAGIAEAIANSGVNVTAINAFGVGKEAIFRIVTSNNIRAIDGIKSRDFEAIERDAVAVDMENEVGMAAKMSKKLKDAGIDITYIYGSTSGSKDPCTIIFNCNDNKKAVEVLNG